MKKHITHILELNGLLQGTHFSWTDPHGAPELHLHGDLWESEALAVAVADHLHRNQIPFRHSPPDKFQIVDSVGVEWFISTEKGRNENPH